MEKFGEFISVGGIDLEVAWHGPPPDEALTLVFLHEGLGCVDMWHDFPARLAAATGCGALVYSRIGYGRSGPCHLPRPVNYMHNEALLVLPGLLDKAEIQHCILIGHSDGGSIALIYAGGTAAEPLRGVFTEAAHVFCEEISVRSIFEIRDVYLNGDLRTKLSKYHGQNVDNAFWGWNDVWQKPEFMEWNIEEYLPKIAVPLLAIQGEDDQYGTAAQLEAIAEKAGGETEVLMLADCGHAPHRDQEEKTFAAMQSFIEKVLHDA